MDTFREGVIKIANKALNGMNEYFDGKRPGTDKVDEFSKMIREGVKVSNRDQVDAQVRRSQAVRLLSFIPKENQASYISLTNPEAKPFLLSKPKKR